jgi:hypothetical protein
MPRVLLAGTRVPGLALRGVSGCAPPVPCNSLMNTSALNVPGDGVGYANGRAAFSTTSIKVAMANGLRR